MEALSCAQGAEYGGNDATELSVFR